MYLIELSNCVTAMEMGLIELSNCTSWSCEKVPYRAIKLCHTELLKSVSLRCQIVPQKTINLCLMDLLKWSIWLFNCVQANDWCQIELFALHSYIVVAAVASRIFLRQLHPLWGIISHLCKAHFNKRIKSAKTLWKKYAN